MAGQKYNKAYEAYQQAVYRDGRNPTFWCSIGVLYFQINQFRDALDAYSRAIRINPYISEVWFDLGSLYESCNNQITDAIDAYARAAELDPGNVAIAQRLQLLRNAQATGGQLPAAPGPQDVHPTAYASSVVPPLANLNGPPLMLQPNNHRQFRSDSRGPPNDVVMPPSSQINPSNRPSPPAPFRGGPPPPVILDESRHIPSHTPLAPMDVDRPLHHNPREYPISRDPVRGPVGHQSLLLQHPLPPQGPSDDPRNGAHPHHQDPYYNRGGPRPPSRSTPPSRPRSPTAYQGYPPRQPVGPAQPSIAPPQRSPRTYHHRELEQESGWDRRPPPPGEPREWDLDRRRDMNYPPHANQQSYYPRSPRVHSPPMPSPRVSHQARYWDNKPLATGPPPHFRPSSPPHPPNAHPPPPALEQSRSRYDPRQDARDSREYDERVDTRGHPLSPEGMRPRNGAPVVGPNVSRPTSPHAATVDKNRRRKEREDHPPSQHAPPQPIPPQFHPPSAPSSIQDAVPKRRKRGNNGKRKEESSQEGHKNFERVPSNVPGNFKNYPKGPGSPENSSSSSRSIQPSPTSATPRPPSRVVDEDYDEGAVDALIGLSGYRATENSDPQSHSPSHSRHAIPSPRPLASHRNSVSSNHTSPPAQAAPLKRGLSPGPEDSDNNKRSRVDMSKRRITPPSGGKRTPVPSTRPSPVPFRAQQASHSPEVRDHFPLSPSLPVVLPPHPRPIGASGHAQTHGSSGGTSSAQIALPPIATLSPPSSAPSPTNHSERDDKMHVDQSLSPPPRGGKLVDVVHRSSRSPASKQTQSPPTEKKET